MESQIQFYDVLHAIFYGMCLCTNVVKNGNSFTTRNHDYRVFFVQIEIEEDDDDEALQNTNSLELA